MPKRLRNIYVLYRVVTPQENKNVVDMPLLGVSTNKNSLSTHFEKIVTDRESKGWKLIRIDYSKPDLDFGDRDIRKATLKKNDVYEYLYLQLWQC